MWAKSTTVLDNLVVTLCVHVCEHTHSHPPWAWYLLSKERHCNIYKNSKFITSTRRFASHPRRKNKDSEIACLCQSIEIHNNKHVYRRSQVRMPIGSEVEWAECSLIIGTGCQVQVFSLIFDSSVGLSAGIESAGDSVPEPSGFESCIQQRMTTCLLSIRKSLARARASKLTINIHIKIEDKLCPHAFTPMGMIFVVKRNALQHL